VDIAGFAGLLAAVVRVSAMVIGPLSMIRFSARSDGIIRPLIIETPVESLNVDQ
jgi:hypothetical protein